jgi:branched-chain amino acid transport system ATP-binding protein
MSSVIPASSKLIWDETTVPLLEIRGLSAGYGANNTVLRGVGATIERGEIVTLVGSNGAGKSTLVKAISGLLRHSIGEILFDGASITGLGPAERLRRGIAHVPEGRQVFAGMTVAENLDLGAYAVPYSAPEQLADVCALFPLLRERMDDLAGNLSGGQQQMLAIARGLMSRPTILLLDEPSLGIAPLMVVELFRLIVQLRDRGVSVLLAEQNARKALSIADRGYVIENGEIVLDGPASQLLSSPEIAQRYFGVGIGTSISNQQSARMAERLRARLVEDQAYSART